MTTKSLQQVCCLTNRAIGLLKHIKQKSKLAKQTNFVYARGSSVLKGEISDDGSEVHDLQEGVGVRIRNVCLESRVTGFVVESTLG